MPTTNPRWSATVRLALLPLLLACISAAPAGQEPSPAREMLELSGTEALGQQMIDQVVRQVRPDLPNVPSAFWADFARTTDARPLIDELAPVYEKHFTPDELADLVRFYRSPVGRKLVRVQPQLSRDSLAAGQRFGTRVTTELMRQLREKQYLR